MRIPAAILALCAVCLCAAADPAPTVQVSGTLAGTAKKYTLAVPVSIPSVSAPVGSYQLPLVLPDGLNLPDGLAGQPATVVGYLFGAETKSLLVTEITPGKAVVKEGVRRKTDLFGDPTPEEKKQEEKK